MKLQELLSHIKTFLIFLGMRKSCEIIIFINLQKALGGKKTKA